MSPWIILAALAGLLSLPWWLPGLVVRARMALFTRINGNEGIEIPGDLDAKHFERLYAHPAANGRSRGARLSDLFWYWLAPGPEVHQEHLEPGPRYDVVAATTRRILTVPRRRAEELARRSVECALRQNARGGWKLTRLRDTAMPIWAEVYYELVFGEPCPARARDLIVDHANDVATALKCCGLRHMRKRDRLTRYLAAKIEAGDVPPHRLPGVLTREEQAFYLQGTFFNTAVVQMSEATAHLLFSLAQDPRTQERIAVEGHRGRTLDHAIAESLRLHPLFGISHRITTAPIALDAETTLPEGSVLCFNHPAYHASGFEDPHRFDPRRWEELAQRGERYIPFGVALNRPCPAQGIALITLRAAALAVVQRFQLHSSAAHTRSLPNRGPCLLVRRNAPLHSAVRTGLLGAMAVRDRWENVSRSLVQLALGTYMVWEARRLRLCERYFDGRDPGAPSSLEAPGGERPAAGGSVHLAH